MDFYINLKVNFRGNAKNFLLSGSETKSWESMEAMVKRSFGLCNLQVTYFDEENEEVSINSQMEYEEALKSASRQGNRLHMNVYETRGQPTRVPAKASGGEPKRGFRPPQHCPTLAQVVSRKVQAAVPEQGMVIMKELKGTKEEDKTPPAWFTSYMEKFKDQVVREAVEKICREFSGQCCIHKPIGAEAQIPEVTSSTLPGGPSSTPACSSCRGQTAGGGYQCSVCTSCTLCEPCSFSHDPSHNLVRARTPLSIPEHGSPAPDHSRFYRRGDRSFHKAEKQRLKAEKRQLKAEVKEIRKQLKMERRGLQWSAAGDGSSSPVLLQPRATQANSPERPKRPCPLVVPAMTALFLDENLPDGTRLRPGTKFIKYWKMRNTGSVSWSTETKLKFMWGNLAVASGDRWREVAVPFLQPGQVGVVSVALCAPALEGSYTSHWRLAHGGEQFGPRVWCSIVVDPLAPAAVMADGVLVSPCVTPQGKNPLSTDKGGKSCAVASRDQVLMSVDQDEREYYIPSVDLLTAQDLLSFELLDINIVQELESVPNNTPADMTPCISPLPHDSPLQEKPTLRLIQEEAEAHQAQGVTSIQPSQGLGPGAEGGRVPAQEEGEEDMSGTQFVCETVMRSLTLEEAPDQTPLHGNCPVKVVRPAAQGGSASSSLKGKGVEKRLEVRSEKTRDISPVAPALAPPQLAIPELMMPDEGLESDIESICMDARGDKDKGEDKGELTEGNRGARSRSSSASSEDYIIILPDCFDTSRPLGESMYSSALSQPGDAPDTPTDPDRQGRTTPEGEQDEAEETVSGSSSANDMLCTSQTLDAVPLTPVVVAPPRLNSALTPSLDSNDQTEAAAESLDRTEVYQQGESENGSKQPDSQPDSPSASGDSEDNSEDPRHPGITGGLVKGALSVAASAYKALFTGQPGPVQPPVDGATQDTMMGVLVEMGFGDRPLNQRLLKKHNYNLLDVVNELVQMTDNDWYSTRY
ncbi:next to BRCA1 gene 1 protein-like [Salvelinus fontinalis]|uniref:next to BRCA1 gene 1 protein-like n=1 Tax=Salvelinus fontinalis TaxID=8038 RepID=UPI0024854B86|nr:next to BRCA1 gene 1 protein-like [Salvelinus fontinalis]